jgi:beta-galactosidase
VPADVAIVLDWESWWALEDLPRPAHDLRLLPQLRAHHAALWSLNVTADLRPPDADLGAYKLVVVPSLFAVGDAAAANLRAAPQLVVGPFSGINDERNAVRAGRHPAAFAARLGLWTEDFWPPAGPVGLAWPGGRAAGRGEEWAEWVELDGAEPVLTFAEGELTGRPAVTRHAGAWYFATRPEPPLLRALYADIVATAGVAPVLAGAPPGVEAVRRGGTLFLLNHGAAPVGVRVGERVIELPPRGVARTAAQPSPPQSAAPIAPP